MGGLTTKNTMKVMEHNQKDLEVDFSMTYIMLRSFLQFLSVGNLDNYYKGQLCSLVPRFSLDLHSNPDIFSNPWPT